MHKLSEINIFTEKKTSSNKMTTPIQFILVKFEIIGILPEVKILIFVNNFLSRSNNET